MFCGRSASFSASGVSEKPLPARRVPTHGPHLTDFLPPSPTHPPTYTAVRWRQGRWSEVGLGSPSIQPPPCPPSRSSSLRTPFPLPLAVPRKPELVQFGFQREAGTPCNILSPPDSTHRNFVSSCRGECAKNLSNQRQQQAQKCSQRLEAPKLTPSLSETGA